MKLCRLLNRVVVYELMGDVGTEIRYLSHNSKDIRPDTLFFCIEGLHTDGREYAEEAVRNGAVAIVTDKPLRVKAAQIIVKNTRRAMSVISQNFFGNPSQQMKLIAVTGTNGKTSVCHIIKEIYTAAGRSIGVVGTNGVLINGQKYDCDLTTPDPIVLNKTFSDMLKVGIKNVVFEASAHAIALHKLDGITADVAVFTNFSRDHLDFFESMEEYAEVKRSFFVPKHARCAVVNADDGLGMTMQLKPKLPTLSYGINNPVDVFAMDYAEDNGLSYLLNLSDELVEIKCGLSGIHNVYNTMAAACACFLMGIKSSVIAQGIGNVKRIDGRDMRYKFKDATVCIDFAHTPDGFDNILSLYRRSCHGRLITVFGCGGDRDRTKRALMGEIASRYSDEIIITSDNPRSEEPLSIMTETAVGVNVQMNMIEDRRDAVRYALSIAKSGDFVAILGKGVEEYIEMKDGKIQYCDVDFVEAQINAV